MKSNTKTKVGLFGVGLNTYWDQFEGLKSRLIGYQQQIAERFVDYEMDIVDLGLVDSPELAVDMGNQFRESGIEALFLYISTYALSSTVLPVVQRAGVPVIVLNLQPVAQMDYEAFNALEDRGLMTGIWLEHCQACSAPEIACVFERTGVDFHLVTGYLDDPEAWSEIEQWLSAINVKHKMANNRVGVLGHYYGGMLDVYSDMTQHSAAFGNHFEILEMCELKEIWEAVSDEDMEQKLLEFQKFFEVRNSCTEHELLRAARTSVALDRLAQLHDLGSLAYYYEGQNGNDYETIVTSVIAGNTLLTGRNIPVAGECEIKNVQAMKILDLLGKGGSFSELYLADFKDDVVYFGHDGPAHYGIAQGRVELVPLPVYHGKPGQGLSIQMTVVHGPVTLISIVQKRNGTLMMLLAEGESVAGPVLKIGNTNSRYQFPISCKSFLQQWCEAGPAHHCAIGVGHLSGTLRKLAKLWRIEFQQVC